MLDLHCHILPGVDDGSASLHESVEMVRQALADGVSGICATPHYGANRGPDVLEQYAAGCAALTEELARLELPLRLFPGVEFFAERSSLELVRNGRVLTLNGSAYLLTEFDFGSSGEDADYLLSAICDSGYIPVIAHPERCHCVQHDRDLLFRWAEEGLVLQLNKGSLFGRFGRRAAELAYWAIDMGVVHAVASDAHSPFRRTVRLAETREFLSERFFPELAELLLSENPRAVCEGKAPVPAYIKYPWNEDRL